MQRRNLVYAFVIAVALVVMGAGFITAETGDPEAAKLDSAIETFAPTQNELVLRQSTILVDLASEYTGVLQIDGVEIPDDQVFFDDGQKLIAFTPGEGRDFEEFEPGQHCVTAVFWRLADGREGGARTASWCFNVS